MDEIDRMRAFALVATNASFIIAAQRTGISARWVRKYVAVLENALGVQLLNRTTRSVSLTDVGTTYLTLCEPLLDGFDELEERVRNEQESLRGASHISAPTGFGALRLVPSIARFAAKHPNVELDLKSSDRRVSIVEVSLDLAVRIGPMRDSSFKIRQLGRKPLVVCASPAELERAGMPSHPTALATRECILDDNMTDSTAWKFKANRQEEAARVNGRFRMNAPTGSPRLATAGTAFAR